MQHTGVFVPDEDEEWVWVMYCPVCGVDMDWENCDQCDDGYSDHDCGEDTCCCLHPEPNVVCELCDGNGGWWQCWNTNSREHAAGRLDEEVADA